MDNINKKLEKLPQKKDKRTLKLAKYLDFSTFPPIPEKIIWSKAISKWTMMKNDEVGDCAIAGIGHIIQTWTANESTEKILTDDQIVDNYSAICGYDKENDQNDNGCIMLDVLNYWRAHGIETHDIEGYVSVNPKNKTEIKAALYLFGSIYIGLNLPLYAENNNEWTVPPIYQGEETIGSWGGHAVIIVDADDDNLQIISWGKRMRMDWKFFQKYCDEAYAAFGPEDWITDGSAPNGFNIDELRKNLRKF